jgi:hypothetical protein
MSAVSVFGRTGHQSASRKPGASARVGLITRNSMPAAFRRAQPLLHRVLAAAARRDLPVLEREPAERDDELRRRHDARPVGDAAGDRLVGADHVRQQELRRAPAVVADLVDAAAAREEEAADERARVVQPAGRGPAVRPAEDAPRAVLVPHARELVRDEAQRGIPTDLDERLPAAQRAVAAVAVAQPAGANRRARDAEVRMDHRRDRGQHGRRRGVERERLARRNPVIRHDRRESAPVAEGGEASGSVHRSLE